MELQKLSSIAEDVVLVLETCEKYRGKPAELRALFDTALRFVLGGEDTPTDAYDKIIELSIGHASLQSPCLMVVDKASLPMRRLLRHALVTSGRTMDAFQIAAMMEMPLTREEIVLLGSNPEPLVQHMLSPTKELLDYAERQQLPELDLQRLRTQVAKVERAYAKNPRTQPR